MTRRRWVASLDDPTRQSLETDVFEPLRTADAVFALRNLGAGAQHDWAGVHSEFHEFVAVTAAGRLVLIVAADD
jgi:hypothetical protein